MNWFSFLFSTDALQPLERAILTAVEESLEQPSRDRYRKQLAVINKVQRLTNGREVNLYSMSGGVASFDDALRFPGNLREARLATVLVKGPWPEAVRADVWIANGRVFSLTFDQPPPALKTGTPLEIANVKMWLDPTKVVEDTDRPGDPAGVLRWFGSAALDAKVEDVSSAPKRELVEARLAEIDATIPSDLADLLSLTGGFRIGDCVVHGAPRLRSLILEEGEFIVVAEREQGDALAVRRGDRRGVVYFLRHDGPPLEKGGSFRSALTRFCTQGC